MRKDELIIFFLIFLILISSVFIIRELRIPTLSNDGSGTLELEHKGNYTIVAIIRSDIRLFYEIWLFDWVANGQSGKTKIVIHFDWQVSVSDANFNNIKFYIYFKHGSGSWYLYTTRTYTSQSSSASVTIYFDDLDNFFDNKGIHLDDGYTHTLYVKYEVTITVTGALTGDTYSDTGEETLGSFTLKWEDSGGDGGGLPPGGVDIINATTYKMYLAIPLASIPPVLVVTALYLDVFSPRFSKPTAKIRELMKRRRRGKKKC